MSRKTHTGFTLIELLVTLAVVAILAAIAYPIYEEALLRSRRAQARAAILELLQQQELYMTQFNTYLAFANLNGITTPAKVPFKVYAGDDPDRPPYWLSAAACPMENGQLLSLQECVKVTATPTRADTAVGALTMTSSGVKSCDTASAAKTNKQCWP